MILFLIRYDYTFNSSNELLEVFFFMAKKKVKLEFNIVNVYKHEEYFDRLLSVEPVQALRLHALLMKRINNNSHNRKTNTVLAKPTDDAAKLGISRSTYQKYKVALINAGLWEYTERFKNHHRIAGDWHISEDLLDDPFDRHVSSDDTSNNADISSNSENADDKNNGKNKKLVSPDDTSKNDKNKKLVSPDDTRVVSCHDTYIYSILYTNTIDDDDTKAIYNYLKSDGYPFRYTGKVLTNQLSTFKRIYNKLPSEQRKSIFEKMYYATEKPSRDVLNYLIRCGKNQLKQNQNNDKSGNKKKRVEKGTDWNKKKSEDTGIDTEILKGLFANLNNNNKS